MEALVAAVVLVAKTLGSSMACGSTRLFELQMLEQKKKVALGMAMKA
jgi:hypothetical protein